MTMKTANRNDIIAELLAPYRNFDISAGHGRGRTVEYALIAGAAEYAADALLNNPGSDFWKCQFPLETSGDGAALRWWRETLENNPDADKNFDEYARTPGCEVNRRTAEIVRWMIKKNFDDKQAIAYTSADGDYPIDELFAAHVRERLLRNYPEPRRDRYRRELRNDYTD